MILMSATSTSSLSFECFISRTPESVARRECRTPSFLDPLHQTDSIFLLVRLKNSLAYLYVAENPDIDDDSVPALCALKKMALLDIEGTDMTIDGVRALVGKSNNEERRLQIKLPDSCARYLEGEY
jgi:hypothetical protein